MVMAISFVCPKCGIIKKSAKRSCCGRGGSWFQNCGSAGNAKIHYTWYEGIRVCKTRSKPKAVIGQKLHGVQHKIHDFSDNAGRSNIKTVITALNTSTFTSVNASITTRASTPIDITSNEILLRSPVHTSVSTSIVFGKLLKISIHIGILVMVVFKC